MLSKDVSIKHKITFKEHDPLQSPPPEEDAHATELTNRRIHNPPWALPSNHTNSNLNKLCVGGELKEVFRPKTEFRPDSKPYKNQYKSASQIPNKKTTTNTPTYRFKA
jgi:hypothetical protein